MEKEQWTILLAFLAGCILTNFFGKDLLTTYGVLNEYFLSQYSYHAVDGNRLLCHIFAERGRAAFAIFLLGRVMPEKLFSILVKSVAAASCGFLLAVSVVNLGIKGIVICICALLPQWLFYFAVLFYYANCVRERGYQSVGEFYRGVASLRMPDYLMRGAVLVFGMILGILMEAYVNPVLLGFVVQLF